MRTLIALWAVVATIVATALGVLHFANPYPLVQVPDRGHRLYAVPDQKTHDLMLSVFKMVGAEPYGTFNAGVHQTLMQDGFTVLAYGESVSAAISFPTKNPLAAARTAQQFLAGNGVSASVMIPSPELGDKLVVLRLPFGWDIAYRLEGKDMPQPVWEKKY